MAPQLTPRNGLLRARAGVVDGARDDLLAGAALAGDEHRHVGVLDAVDERVEAAHRRARADEARVAEVAAQLGAHLLADRGARRRAARCAGRAARRACRARPRARRSARASSSARARVLGERGARSRWRSPPDRRTPASVGSSSSKRSAGAQRASRRRARRWCGRPAARRGWARTRSTGS